MPPTEFLTQAKHAFDQSYAIAADLAAARTIRRCRSTMAEF
jgi:hypothetical protein